MFRISHDIIFSAMVHSILLAAALLTGGSSEIRKAHLFTVSLFNELDNNLRKQTAVSASRKSTRVMITPTTSAKTAITSSTVQEILPIEKQEPLTLVTLQAEVGNNSGSGLTGMQTDNNASPVGKDSRSPVSKQTARNRGETGTASMPRGLAEQATQATPDPSLKQKIRGTLQNNLVYPYMARKRRMEGTVLVDFRINQKGIAENVRVLKGSGYPLLDSAAMETVVKSSPFPLANYSIEVPITYQLTQN